MIIIRFKLEARKNKNLYDRFRIGDQIDLFKNSDTDRPIYDHKTHLRRLREYF